MGQQCLFPVRQLIILLMLFGLVQVAYTQTNLSAGDIAIIGANTDDPDDFAFVLLVDIESGTEIRFTDSGWLSSGSFRGNEGAVKYTAPSALDAGTVISYVENSENFVTDNDAIVGNNGFSLSGSGDQVFAFQGESTSPTFIYALNIEGSSVWQSDATSSNTSALPTGLTNSTSAVAVTEYDNVKYNGSTSFSTPSAALTAISNNSNWEGDNNTRYDLSTFGDFSLPVELTSFTATSRSGKVVLRWITDSEIENLGFILYRQARGKHIELLDHFRTNRLLRGQGSVTYRTEYKYIDEKVRVGQTYAYLLVDVDYHGVETRHSPVSVTVRARGITMKSAYPNPFNPATKFTVIVGDPQHLSINVYDIAGHLVKILTNERVPAGEHIIAWDGTNSRSQIAASGIYFVRLIASGTMNIQKVVLTR